MVETYIKTKEVFWQQQMGRLLTPISLSKRWVNIWNYDGDVYLIVKSVALLEINQRPNS